MDTVQVKIWIICSFIGMVIIQIRKIWLDEKGLSKDQRAMLEQAKSLQRKVESVAKMECPKCAKENEIQAMFCRRCGQRFRSSDDTLQPFT